MQPLNGEHWALGVPWMLLIFVYDELRKLAIRRLGGEVEKVLYW